MAAFSTVLSCRSVFLLCPCLFFNDDDGFRLDALRLLPLASCRLTEDVEVSKIKRDSEKTFQYLCTSDICTSCEYRCIWYFNLVKSLYMKFYLVNIVNDRNRVVYRVYTTCRHFDLPVNYGICNIYSMGSRSIWRI